MIDQAVKDVIYNPPGDADREESLEFFCTSLFDSYCYAIGKNPWDVLEIIDNFFSCFKQSRQGKSWSRPPNFKQSLKQIPGVYYGITTISSVSY